MGYLNKIKYDVFSQRLRALKITLCHLNDIRGIYRPIKNRSRRILLEIGGQLLQGIFGVAIDRDVESIRQSIDNSTNQLWISQNKVTTILNVLGMSFIKLSDAMTIKIRC